MTVVFLFRGLQLCDSRQSFVQNAKEADRTAVIVPQVLHGGERVLDGCYRINYAVIDVCAVPHASFRFREAQT